MRSKEKLRKELELIWLSNMSDISCWSLVLEYGQVKLRINENEVFSGASMIKTFLADIVRRGIEDGRYSWDDKVTLDDIHACEGDGLFKIWKTPQKLQLHDVVTMMLSMSDNTATNAIIDFLGSTEKVNSLLCEAGWKKSRLNAWVGGRDRMENPWFPEPEFPSQNGLSMVAAKEHKECFDLLMTNPEIATMLFAQQDKRSLARLVDFPEEQHVFAHKTGTAYGTRHDGGTYFYLESDKPLSVHCLTDGEERDESVDDPACLAMARAMKETVNLLNREDF